MPTFAQTEANRRNAQKSTGPRTEEGKKRSRLNAFKHGLTGQIDIMTGELREAHDAFVARIVLSLNPADALENQLAHSIAESHWRLNRVSTIENALFAESDFVHFDSNQDEDYSDLGRALSAARGFIEHPERFNLLTIYEMRLHRKAQADLKQLRELQAERRAAHETAGKARSAAPVEPPPQKMPAAQPAELTDLPLENGFVCSAGVLAAEIGIDQYAPPAVEAAAALNRAEPAARLSAV